MNPEFTRGAEFATQDDLNILFDLAVTQLKVCGELSSLPQNVARSQDGLPVLTEDDVDNDRTGTRTIKLPANFVSAATLVENLELSRNPDDNLSFWHIPAYYFLFKNALGSDELVQEYVPEQVVFVIPKDKNDEDNIYLE